MSDIHSQPAEAARLQDGQGRPDDPMLGQTVSHYRILQKLGGGGMGVVYAGQDLRLGRGVALKFLPEGQSSTHSVLERFLQEARAASCLNHPNICIVHDVGEFDGRPFIVMELLEGQTLKHRLQTRSLTTADILEFGIQASEGLEYAHSQGIVHRRSEERRVGKECRSRWSQYQ